MVVPIKVILPQGVSVFIRVRLTDGQLENIMPSAVAIAHTYRAVKIESDAGNASGPSCRVTDKPLNSQSVLITFSSVYLSK